LSYGNHGEDSLTISGGPACKLITVLVIIGCVVPAGAAAQASPPPCSQFGTEGARLSGLKARAVVGQLQRFTIETTGSYTTVGDFFHVQIRDHRGKVLNDSLVPPGGGIDVDLRFRWGDRSATVTATGVVADETGRQCRATIVRKVKAINRAYFHSLCYDVRYKPRTVIEACGDAGLQLRRMRWRGWNRKLVRGKGRMLYNDCDPFCAGGHFHSIPVKVTLSRRRLCREVDRYIYTRETYRLSRRPSNFFGPRVSSGIVPCGSYATE
jgi:hypothetical protein